MSQLDILFVVSRLAPRD